MLAKFYTRRGYVGEQVLSADEKGLFYKDAGKQIFTKQVAFWLMEMLLTREAHRNLTLCFPRSNSCTFSNSVFETTL